MKSYYDLLEVSNKASSEVIEKAYKVLVKRYHPDVQANTNKKTADEMMKKINEAYEILSDSKKRAEYDVELESIINEQREKNNINSSVKIYNEDKMAEETLIQKMEIESLKRRVDIGNLEQRAELEKQAQQAYNDAYYKYLADLGYEIKEEITFKQRLKHWRDIILAIIITMFIFWILWLIPPINKLARSLYEENYIIKFLVDFIKEVFKIIFGGRLWKKV